MSKQRLLNILIPTYNRDKELILNLIMEVLKIA